MTFVLVAKGAHSVALAGDFNGWELARHPLADEDDDGVWTTPIELPRG